jgi:putative transposase
MTAGCSAGIARATRYAPMPTASACTLGCANDRQGIEWLCRYITRPAISNERLSICNNSALTPIADMRANIDLRREGPKPT